MLNLTDILQLITKINSYWFDIAHKPRQASWLKLALYGSVLVHALSCAFDYSSLFGPDAYVIRKQGVPATLQDSILLLYYFPQYAGLVLSAIVMLSILSLIGKRTMGTDFFLFLLQYNLQQSIYPGLTGGHQLLTQLLFFNCFLHDSASKITWELRRFLHNFGVLCCILQLVIVYLVAGLAKLGDASWLEGTAVWYTLQIEHLKLFPITHAPINGAFLKLLNYFVLMYQLAFVPLLAFAKIRKPLLYLGFGIYLYIGLYMGLVMFAVVMLSGHILLWPDPSKKS